ncbi:hypothetical protein GCM10009096_13150 [Parasphingorhabdus litoris]|uniref:DUF4345 domain-containing protein n=1 Tax=Parasphingorhabdus litoris TaxID=394733 RepID=A0ABN1ACP1_9SPHN|nr:hypothetical protein [Parasphingorhabdus litoris]
MNLTSANLNSKSIARTLFALAALYGVPVLLLGLFGEAQFNAAMPPAITHPEFYYGFHGVALVFQLVFVLIAIDPLRYRPLMLVAVLEKLAFFVPALWLYTNGRLAEGGPFYGAMIDGLWAFAFLFSWWLTRPKEAGTG